jgi:hypothetical protein
VTAQCKGVGFFLKRKIVVLGIHTINLLLSICGRPLVKLLCMLSSCYEKNDVMLEDHEYLGIFSSGVVKPGFMTADVTQEWSSLAFVEHHDPLHSVCLHQTERVPLEQGGGHIAWAVSFFPSLPRRGSKGDRFFTPCA